MLLNSSENDNKLFAKTVPISVKDVYTNQTRKSNLFLTMEWQDTSSGLYSPKVLVISLTDNDDPFFLYNLHLSEEDFQTLKTSQDLLINFSSFPQHIIDYIETCLLEEKNPQPKFLLVFTINEKLGSVASPSQLDIIETNQFKHLTHLSLKFIAATESAVRQYLASCFRSLKEKNFLLQNKLSSLEQDSRDKLDACQRSLGSKEQELELLRKDFNAQLTKKDSKHALAMKEERNRSMSLQKEEEERHERERREKENSFRKQIQQLEGRVSCLDTLNKELQDRNYKHESTIRELRSHVLSLEDETRRLNETIQSLRQKCDDLHSELRGKKSHIHHLNEQISDKDQELRSKIQSIAGLKEQIKEEAKQLKTVKQQLDHANLHLGMNEDSFKTLEDDKSELNKIILNLQERIKHMTTTCDLSAKYKEALEEKEKILLDLKKEIAEANINLEARSAKVKSLTNSLECLHKKIENLEVELKTKENVIKWLNRQLTDNCIIPQYISPFNPPVNLGASPSSLAQEQLAQINSGALRKSQGSGNSPLPYTTANTASQKPVRTETPTGVRKNSCTPSRFHATNATDSAYCTCPSTVYNQASPDNFQSSPNMNFDETNCEIDQTALSAAFGDGNKTVKHSTAKKATRPVRPVTPKTSKKR